MSEQFAFDVFFSYSSKDKAVVHALAERLRHDGLRVWLDAWEIKPGDSTPAKTEDGLERSRILVLCMSAHAFVSDWAMLESQTFRFRDPLNKERRFIPLRLDEAEAPIKGSLARFQSIEWIAHSEQQYTSLIEACRPPIRRPALESEKARRQYEEKVASLGHTRAIRSVAISSDGQRALSGSGDKTLRLWDLPSGRCLRVVEGHTNSVSSVAFSSDGQSALSGSHDKTLRLWDLPSGRCLRVLEGHTDIVRSVAFSSDGQHALSGSHDKTLRLWDLPSGRCLRVLEGHTDSVWSVAFSSDGESALSGSHDKTLRLWDLPSGRCLRVFEGHTDIVRSVAFSSDGQSALSGSDDRTLRLWDLPSGRCLRVLKGHTDRVRSVAFSSDGQSALSGSDDNTLRLWDVASGLCLRVLKGHTAIVSGVAFSSDGQRALSGCHDNTLKLWDVAGGLCLRVFEGHTASVSGVAFSGDAQSALSGSHDKTLRLWDVDSGLCLRVFEGHTNIVWSVAFSSDGERALSGSHDYTLRLWDVASGRCLRVFEGHTARVRSVAFSSDGQRVLSASDDDTLRLWDVDSGHCLSVLEGHTDIVNGVAFSSDGQRALSASDDKTLRLWDLSSGRCLRVLEGHTDSVSGVAFSSDGQRALSGADDKTLRLWDLSSGHCLRVLEGHTDIVSGVAFSSDGQRALSGADDKTLRLWDLSSGRCLRVLEGHTDIVSGVAFSSDGQRALSGAVNGVLRSWNLREASPSRLDPDEDQVQYTNAKVLLVGDTTAGKTGLAHRLATGVWKPSDGSTVGAWSTQWRLPDRHAEPGVEREIWLWDFGGQADQRLINILYMDRAALVLLLFNADQEDVLSGLRDWQTALRRAAPGTRQFLVAGRIDTGFKASRSKLKSFATENHLAYYETSAVDGTGCEEMRKAILDGIPWDDPKWVEQRTSPRLFKVIKDQILKLRDEGRVLVNFKELRELLWRRIPEEAHFRDDVLRTVIGLLDGPGVVKELDYGTYILLQPEWVNAYAQAVIRTLRSGESELGSLPLRSIAEGKLVYQSAARGGGVTEMERLPRAEERVVLGEMERQLIERGLCLQQGDKLVFPSHCGRERPEVVEHPSVFVSYAVKGYLDDIYATLVVKLADSQSFNLKELWRDAADFDTLNGGHRMGIKLTRGSASSGDINVYFGRGVTEQEQVIFANYIHAHLGPPRSEQVLRLREYVCPNCNTPKGNPHVLMEKLLAQKQKADTECDKCGKRFLLWDALEQRFARDDVREAVEGLQAQDVIRLDARRKGKLLALEVGARITSADQKCFEIPATEDEGLDMELEFTDDQGKGTGKRLYLQLKAGNSYLKKRKTDGVEIFAIKKQGWVEYWLKQQHPVMLVVGTFSQEETISKTTDRLEFADVRWMEITSVLHRESENGTRPVKQIEFKGERLDLSSVREWRKKILGQQRTAQAKGIG